MPRSWQIIQARALQTQGVWDLSPDFTVRSQSRDNLSDLTDALAAAASAEETAENVLDTHDGVLGTEYEHFKSMNVAIGARLDSEVPDDEPLQRDIDQITRIVPSGRDAIDERALKTIACWKKVNAARAAAVPPELAITVRGTQVAAYETRWLALPAKRQLRETAAGEWRAKNSLLRTAARALDLLNKDWYQAWKSEFPPGTPEGDALAGVDTETGGYAPQILEIAAVMQEGLSLRVTYVPDTGEHATVLDLLWQVEGVHADYQRVTADLSGNVIGPFTAGQVVRVRTDVGNSRDHSEMSPEQVVTVTAVP